MKYTNCMCFGKREVDDCWNAVELKKTNYNMYNLVTLIAIYLTKQIIQIESLNALI